jgi:nucleoside-diphosphate-sugar epimerase
MTSAGGNHALIFGASGITGWAIVNEILNGYPDRSTFSKVTALTNRPLTQEVSQWPSDDRLNIVSGLNLLEGSQQDLEKSLRARVDGVDTVTHVYVSRSVRPSRLRDHACSECRPENIS